MLTMLHIENIAVIEKADIELDVGFTVMTGETGAGKSIVIDSIGAVLGERTSREIIRTGAASAMVSAVFSGLPGTVRTFLNENGVSAEDGELLIQREMFPDGRNVCRLNGRPFTVSMLRTLGMLLVNIHGQHDSQQLLDESCHLSYLDSFARNEALLREYEEAYRRLADIRREMDGLTMDEAEKARKIDLLKYAADEIESADLQAGEEEELLSRRNLLKNAGRITEAVEDAFFLFFGDEESDGICSQFAEAAGALSAASGFSDELSALCARVEELSFQADDVSGEIRNLRNTLDFSPGELDAVEERLDAIYRLKQKYGPDIGKILEYLEKCKTELENIEFSQERLDQMKKSYVAQYDLVQKLADGLTETRVKAASRLEKRILGELRQLDMQKIDFRASFSETRPAPGPKGKDEVRFLISTNLGEPLKPLAKIASGGELARIMLALKNVLAEDDEVSTLIFDEVDSGVSGRAARKVAEKLYDVSRHRQVLCVTHLPQLAAMADTHFLIEKGESGGRTVTRLIRLDYEDRLKEIARITGGVSITDISLQNAAELLKSAGLYKDGRGRQNDLV